jgi:hypothetical protein
MLGEGIVEKWTSGSKGAGWVREGLKINKWWTSGTWVVVWIAVGTVAAHLLTGSRYGFDRDELMALEDARHLAWGYVQYPPMTAFFGRVALSLFGTSLVGFRFFAALAQALAVMLTGWMAREMGGSKWAQITAALAAVPFCLGGGALMQYISFDYLCWVWVAYCMVRVTTGDGDRWWLGVGIGMGLGMLSKWTMGFLVCGAVVGVLLTELRRHLKNGWLWLGVSLAWGIWLPNLIWQWKQNFISLEFLRFLHVRDVGEGLTDWFLLGQVELTLLALPIALAGIWFCFFAEEGKQFRIIGWMYFVPLAMYLAMRGRDYYLAPGYPMLYAAGAVWIERRLHGITGSTPETSRSNWIPRAIWAALVLDVIVAGAVALPIAPVNSGWWKFASRVDSVFPEEIGWSDFVQSVANVWYELPAEERLHAGILAGNYGEIGALNLYGPGQGLPGAISGVNSSWERGFGNPPPGTVVVVGYTQEFLQGEFASCRVGGHVWNHEGIQNEETIEDPDIFVCRGLKESWPEFWKKARRFA